MISVARNDVKPVNRQQNNGFGCRGQNFGQSLYFTKGISAVHSALRLINEFSAKGWKKNTLNDFVKCLKQTGSITKKSGSSRPRGCQSVPHTTNSSHGQLIKQSIRDSGNLQNANCKSVKGSLGNALQKIRKMRKIRLCEIGKCQPHTAGSAGQLTETF